MAAAARRNVVSSLMRTVNHHTACPCHTCLSSRGVNDVANAARAIMSGGRARTSITSASSSHAGTRGYATPVNAGSTDYAFEVSAANLRFGEGVTVSVLDLLLCGKDWDQLGAGRTLRPEPRNRGPTGSRQMRIGNGLFLTCSMPYVHDSVRSAWTLPT